MKFSSILAVAAFAFMATFAFAPATRAAALDEPAPLSEAAAEIAEMNIAAGYPAAPVGSAVTLEELDAPLSQAATEIAWMNIAAGYPGTAVSVVPLTGTGV